MTGDASEYGRLLAERDRLIADGADPAELLVPVPPTGPVPTSLNDSIRRARPTAHTPLGDLVAGRIDQAEYRRRMADLERRAADSLDAEPAPARRRPEPDRSGAVIVWLAAGLGLVLLAIAVAGIIATLEGSQP